DFSDDARGMFVASCSPSAIHPYLIATGRATRSFVSLTSVLGSEDDMTTDTLDGLPKRISGARVKWWQWILMYPTLAISLFGSVPTIIQLFYSHKLDVPFERVPGAKRQSELWETNFECARKGSIETITTDLNTQVSVTMCPSGDVLVTVQRPDSRQVSRWI